MYNNNIICLCARWRVCVCVCCVCTSVWDEKKKTGLPNTCARVHICNASLLLLILLWADPCSMYIYIYIYYYTVYIIVSSDTPLSGRNKTKNNNNIMSSYAYVRRIYTIEHKHNINSNEFT